jgi:hypothetical protein
MMMLGMAGDVLPGDAGGVVQADRMKRRKIKEDSLRMKVY